MFQLKTFAQILLLFGLINNVTINAQEKEKFAEPGNLIKIKINNFSDLNDPKFRCFPENDSWEAVRTFDNQVIIIFSTNVKGTYTFVLAGNKDNKTILSIYTIIIGPKPGPEPNPSPPEPIIEGKYTKDLRPIYLTSPDNKSLLKLIEIYSLLANKTNNITSYKQLSEVLAQTTKEILGETSLINLRDKVALILQTDLANRNATVYDPEKAKLIFIELAKSLKPLISN